MAAFVHGALASLHLLGVAYNVRNKNHKCAAAHLAGAAFSAWAVRNHVIADRHVGGTYGIKYPEGFYQK